jgi:tetratricopeptide (TPR) repeat protein
LLELDPTYPWTRIYLGKTLLARGDPQAALAMVEDEPDESIRLLYLPIVLHAAGKHAEATEALKAQIAEWEETGAYFVAQTYAHRGDRDLAFEWLERAHKQKDPGLIEMTGEPLLDGIFERASIRRLSTKDDHSRCMVIG